ncbi:MAG: hypothetical protein KBD46_00155 [Candidatus Levybacteria bacterium]|nr:hypothetical protein [Candidatus Levybacteria bacterium]
MISIEYLRQFRIAQFAIFDTTAAYVGILILSPILTWLMSKLHIKIPIISWLWFTLPLSVIFHMIFHQSTPLMKILANPGHFQFYIAIFILFVMTYMGFRKISKIRSS